MPCDGLATPELKRKRCRSTGFLYHPVNLPHQAKAILLATLVAIGYRTHFAAILRAKSLSLSIWCGKTIRLTFKWVLNQINWDIWAHSHIVLALKQVASQVTSHKWGRMQLALNVGKDQRKKTQTLSVNRPFDSLCICKYEITFLVKFCKQNRTICWIEEAQIPSERSGFRHPAFHTRGLHSRINNNIRRYHGN